MPDNETRLGLRVALKLMAALAVVGVAGVALDYLTSGATRAGPAAPMRVPVGDLAPGAARTLLWDGRPVIVVRRRDREHWFVAFAADPARGCPVRWRPEAREFHSACGPARYDRRGRALGGGPGLALPPHRVTDAGMLVLGRR